MTDDQLNRGQIIRAQLQELRTHRKIVENIRSIKGAYIRIDTSTNFEKLKEHYLPMPLIIFTKKYIENLDKEISDLETEFNNL